MCRRETPLHTTHPQRNTDPNGMCASHSALTNLTPPSVCVCEEEDERTIKQSEHPPFLLLANATLPPHPTTLFIVPPFLTPPNHSPAQFSTEKRSRLGNAAATRGAPDTRLYQRPLAFPVAHARTSLNMTFLISQLPTIPTVTYRTQAAHQRTSPTSPSQRGCCSVISPTSGLVREQKANRCVG